MQVRISKWGNSLAVRLPKQLAEQLDLTEGQTVDLAIVDDMIKIATEPATRIPRYKLSDLIREAEDLGSPAQPETVDWGPDRGAEIIEDDYAKRR